MGFSVKQVKQLLQGINPRRVLKDGKGKNHVAYHDIAAHLTRIFGFGGWHKEVKSIELLFEEPNAKNASRWDVAYKALVRLTVKDAGGNIVCFYEDGSIGSAQNQARADAHDLAYKSAISLSVKRCAKDLGDQFGLSLYEKGRIEAIVGGTLVGVEAPAEGEVVDVQADLVQVTSLGNDEVDHSDEWAADAERQRLRDLCADRKWDMNKVAKQFKGDLKTASAELISAYINTLLEGLVKVDDE